MCPVRLLIHILAPSCGLPSVGGFPKLRSGQLLQILKGADGSTEAPRYLPPRERLTGTELRSARAVFVKHDAGRKMKVISLGTRSCPIYLRVKELINTLLDM